MKVQLLVYMLEQWLEMQSDVEWVFQLGPLLVSQWAILSVKRLVEN